MWTTDGVQICSVSDRRSPSTITSDGVGGAIITWDDDRNGNYDIYAQRIAADGSVLWVTDGVAACTAPNNQYEPMIASDGASGAIITWGDFRDRNWDIYAQRIAADGSFLWTTNGVAICTTTDAQHYPKITSDGAGGAIITWDDFRDGNWDIYAQRIGAGGGVLWSADGVAISTDGNRQQYPVIISSGGGGAIVAWDDSRRGNYGIYAQGIYPDGSLSSIQNPVSSSPGDGGVTPRTPNLIGSDFTDSAQTVTHMASQWRVNRTDNLIPEVPDASIAADNEHTVYPLAFTFPFFGRSMTAISVNTNGLIELLESGETCHACADPGTHSAGGHIGHMDAIFASNDDLTTDSFGDSDYMQIFNLDSRIMIEWFGSTNEDNDSGAYPLHFQVLMDQDGTIVWNFKEMSFDSHSFDMYSGLYANGGPEIDVGYAINTQSSWVFDPATQSVSQVAYNWVDPDPAIHLLHDSGETSAALSAYTVPESVSLIDRQTYYWAVRYKNDIGDWTPWSAPASFTVDAVAPNVSSVSPLDGATAIAVNKSITATFSEAMDAAAINAASFTLDNGLTGSVAYDADTKTATFTPASALAHSTTYTATITSSVTDQAGNGLEADFIWSFTTEAAAEAPPVDPAASLIAKYYQDILDRDPDEEAAAFWQNELKRCEFLGVDVKEGFMALARLFFNSEEYLAQDKTATEYVTDLYQTFFNRAPDPAGLDYWVALLEQGVSRSVVLNYFVYGEEFRVLMAAIFGDDPGSPARNLVNDLYRGFHSRLPDTAGFQGWVNRMQAAMGQGEQAVRDLALQIALGFLQSEEYVLRDRSDAQFLEDLYNGILRRGAQKAEVDGWLEYMQGGMTREEVLGQFIRSLEFELRVEAILDAA
ncbi:MAG: DUF4214 domain-containing protein [Desulfobacterales bacterium]|nr:MAG: DUF4214 domain-containing protein [Desulfobacterales bacterium]